MAAEPGASGGAPRAATDREIDALFARAAAAEQAGELRRALAALEHAIAHCEARGKRYQYLYEWRARLEGGLGEHARAESSLVVAREIAAAATGGDPESGDRLGVFRMDVARAERATAALNLACAEQLLAGLRDDAGALGPVTVERRDEIVAWLRGLTFHRRPAPNLAIPRVEAALALAAVWAERGKYRSALRVVEAIDRDLPAAEVAIRTDEVRLFEIELRLEAGQIERARAQAASLAQPDDAVAGVRQALIRARIGLAAGRLREAYDQLDGLAAAPTGDPSLFASAAATRAAILVELNLWRRAQEVATTAIDRLGPGPASAPLAALLARANAGAAARGRSVMAVWEQPVDPPRAGRRDRPSVQLPGAAVGAPWRLASAWIAHANAVLEALERDDARAAAEHQRALEAVTAGIESDHIAARVRLSAQLIAYATGPGPATFDALCRVADTLRSLGARAAEAQATRYAAWAAARLQRRADYVALARRSSAIIEDIARELPPVERRLYLTNKWSGRDELVAARMRELLDDGDRPRRPVPREVCQVFREIDVLTHWSIDNAFGDRRAEALLDATSDAIVPWIREMLLAPPANLRGGFRLRSPASLWWIPARTLILHYHVLPDHTYLFRIARRHIDVVRLAVGRVHLRIDMRGLLGDPAELAGLADDLGVRAALARFPGIRRLLIVPHDAVANVPFAALPVDGEPLCKRVVLAQLDRLERLRRRRWLRWDRRCLGVGLSCYAGSGAADLPFAEDEARAVAALAGRAPSLTGEAASCDAVLAALQQASRVHVAAHGATDPEDPAQSGLLLREGAGHRTLTLRELRRAAMRRLHLVTLATCRSAQSALLPGGERICLPTALLDAGARGVIAALWPVDDQASLDTMTALYRHLRSERPAVALARTQAELQDRPAEHWAGWVFYGND